MYKFAYFKTPYYLVLLARRHRVQHAVAEVHNTPVKCVGRLIGELLVAKQTVERVRAGGWLCWRNTLVLDDTRVGSMMRRELLLLLVMLAKQDLSCRLSCGQAVGLRVAYTILVNMCEK